MALTRCKECGHQVSDTAKACPSCGSKIKQGGRAWIWAAVGIGGLVVAFFTLGGVLHASRSPDEVFTDEAQRHVAARLKNPESAHFGPSFIVRTRVEKDGREMSAVALCGVVDGKNAFGAYTGGSRFVADGYQGGKTVAMVGVEIEDSDRRATVRSRETDQKVTIFEEFYWNERCVSATHPPTYSGEL